MPNLPPELVRQQEMFARRVDKTFRRLHKVFERKNIGAFRLYDRDIPEIRAVLDYYEGHLVLAEYMRTQSTPEWLPAMADAASFALDIPLERVHLRERRTRPEPGPAGSTSRYSRLAKTGHRIAVREGDLAFLCNLEDFLDTGLFADHRDTRALVRAEANGADFLNLYAYTGAFTCAAAKGGARTTSSIDLSQAYLDWARDNLAHNALDDGRHELVRADTFDFLGRSRREGRKWQLAVVDPPSFSVSKSAATNPYMSGDFDIQRDHRRLLDSVLAVMAPGGVVWFSTNHQRFEPQLDGLASEIKDMTELTVPEDYRNRTVHRCWRMVVAPVQPGG